MPLFRVDFDSQVQLSAKTIFVTAVRAQIVAHACRAAWMRCRFHADVANAVVIRSCHLRCRFVTTGRRIGKPVKVRRCPRNGGGVQVATGDHWAKAWEGVATVRKDTPEPGNQPEISRLD